MNGTERTTCLVADDHPAVVEAVADVLAEHGIEVVARARDGREALDRIEALKPDVALLDLRMPALSGIEVARSAGRSAPDSSVILYTAFARS
jgi:DNA-binding NarL/FixJ family response regulator